MRNLNERVLARERKNVVLSRLRLYLSQKFSLQDGCNGRRSDAQKCTNTVFTNGIASHCLEIYESERPFIGEGVRHHLRHSVSLDMKDRL
jgi:hypothetical protein